MLIPFLIAAQRFIVLGEVARGYSFDAPNPRVLKFYGTWIILGIVAAVPTMLAIALAVAAHTLAWWIFGAVALPLVAGLTILCLRMTILLPAIAIDAPGANWLNANHDTRRHTLGIFFIFLVVFVLYVSAATIVYTSFLVFTVMLSALFLAMALAPPAVAALFKVLAILVVNAVTLIGLTQFVAVASRLYQMLGDHVKNPPSEV